MSFLATQRRANKTNEEEKRKDVGSHMGPAPTPALGSLSLDGSRGLAMQ